MQEFGRSHYKQIATIRLDRDAEIRRVFETHCTNPEQLLLNLQARVGFRITPEDTLLILDEIQECPAALTSLKYFCEDAREYHIIAAGSLLGVHQHNGTGFPVGKVNIQHLYPMSFSEFLIAMGKEQLCEELTNCNRELVRSFAPTLTEMLRLYYYIGGMPEVVSTYLETQDFNAVREVQHEILASYTNDFSKHIPSALRHQHHTAGMRRSLGRPQGSELVVGIAIQAGAVGFERLASLAGRDEPLLHGLFSQGAEASHEVTAIILHIGKDIGHAVALFLLRIDRAAVFQMHAHHVRIAKQVVDVAQRLLISTHQEHGHIVILRALKLMQRQRVRHVLTVDEIIHFTIAIAGNIH